VLEKIERNTQTKPTNKPQGLGLLPSPAM